MGHEQGLRNAVLLTKEPERFSQLQARLSCRGVRLTLHEAPSEIQGPELTTFELWFVDAPLSPVELPWPAGEPPRVVILGRSGNSTEILEALRLGARDYLGPDFEERELDEVLDRSWTQNPDVQCWLEYTDSADRSRRVRLASGRTTIGRDASNAVQIDSTTVSRFHAVIEMRGTEPWAIDSGSRHGTYVNGVQVREWALMGGDEVRLGGLGAPTLVLRQRRPSSDDRSGTHTGGVLGAPNREFKDIASLLDTFLTLKSDLLLDDLLQIVVLRSIELADADRGIILLSEGALRSAESGGNGGGRDLPSLRLALALQRDGTKVVEEELQMSRRIPNDVLRTGEGVILEDLLSPQGKEEHPGTIELGVRSAMCVPLRTRRADTATDVVPTVIGVLYVDSTSRAQPFSPRLLQTFESLASEAAQAIFNARLYEVCLEKHRMDEEMRLAHTIQKNFFPPVGFRNDWLEIHGTSRPCREVGGDFLGYYPIGEDNLELAVGDVSGKGVPAAIFSALLDGLCFSHVSSSGADVRLDSVAAIINNYLTAKAAHQKFVSLFLGVVGKDGRLRYVNAGHNAPLKIDSRGSVEYLTTGDVVLGVIEDSEFRVATTDLQSGDTLVLYSDGITEARNASRQFYGQHRLENLVVAERHLPPADLYARVCDDVSEHLGDIAPQDDVTLLIARFL